jgi:(2R)-sulfolactate sulfo-lyase subunit alpha
MPEHTNATRPQFLAHREGDHVAVAVQDLSPGPAIGYVLTTDIALQVDVLDEIPLGHKIALVDLDGGGEVVEYGVQIGVTSSPISAGQHVHTHNMRSARWQSSVAR